MGCLQTLKVSDWVIGANQDKVLKRKEDIHTYTHAHAPTHTLEKASAYSYPCTALRQRSKGLL